MTPHWRDRRRRPMGLDARVRASAARRRFAPCAEWSSQRPSRCLPSRHRAVVLGPLLRRDMRGAALVRRSLKRIVDAFLAAERRVTTTSVVDERLQIGAPGFVEGDAHAAPPRRRTGGDGVWRVSRHWSKVGSNPSSKRALSLSGQSSSPMQRASTSRVEPTNETASHPPLVRDRRR